MNLLDTIAAVSTPYGKGGVALIRISGEDAIMIADRVFRSASGHKLADTEHAKMLYGEIFMPQDRDREGALSLDDVMAVAFRAPHSAFRIPHFAFLTFPTSRQQISDNGRSDTRSSH